MSKFSSYAAIIIISLLVGGAAGGMVVAGWQSPTANWRIASSLWQGGDRAFAFSSRLLLGNAQLAVSSTTAQVKKPINQAVKKFLTGSCDGALSAIPSTTSLVELLQLLGHDSSWEGRQQLALEAGLNNYRGTLAENNFLKSFIESELAIVEIEERGCRPNLTSLADRLGLW